MNTGIFISYARPDDNAAQRLSQELSRRGYQIWRDKESLLPGQDWEQEIKRAIKDAHFVILILSTNAVDRRGFFHKEIRLALDTLQTVPSGQIYLIPVRLDNCKIPEPLGFIHCIDLTPDWENGISRVCAAIEFQNHIRGLIAEREREKSRETVAKASILLVNDEPAAMNTIVDQWRLAGFKIDYAFDVDQAIRKIQENKPTVVVSDMSHFVYGERVTDRAAFEILEWARRSRTELKLIITCAEITPERRRGASELGAIGICNNVLDLEKLLMQAGNLSDIDVHPRMSLWNE